jgi:hypothetical protein
MGLSDYNPTDGLRRGPFKKPEPIQLPKFGTLNASGVASGVTETEKRPVVRESWVAGAVVSCETVGIDVDGTLLLYLCKYDGVLEAEVVLSDALNIEALVTKKTARFVLVSTLTDAQLILHETDTVYAKAVCSSASIDTQPTNLAVTLDVFRRN